MWQIKKDPIDQNRFNIMSLWTLDVSCKNCGQFVLYEDIKDHVFF